MSKKGKGHRVGQGKYPPKRGRNSGPARRTKPVRGMGDVEQLEGRNVVLEAMRRKRRPVTRVLIDERAKPSGKVAEIIALAEEMQVSLRHVARHKLDEMSATGVHNGVIAFAKPHPRITVSALLEDLFERGEDPFVVLVDQVSYEQNLGAIMRSAMGAGVHAVVVPVRRGKGLSPVVQRVAMGGAEVVPLIREGLSSALATLKRAGVRIVGADMGGRPLWEVPMDGPLALVLGGEDKGLTDTLQKRCDAVVSVPLSHGLDSLNVSVTAGVMMFEKCRQDQAG